MVGVRSAASASGSGGMTWAGDDPAVAPLLLAAVVALRRRRPLGRLGLGVPLLLLLPSILGCALPLLRTALTAAVIGVRVWSTLAVVLQA